MRSAACLRVIRFRQSGQYLTLFDFDAKDAPHSVHFLCISSVRIKLGVQFLIRRKYGSAKPLAEQRIGNKLRAYASVPIVQ